MDTATQQHVGNTSITQAGDGDQQPAAAAPPSSSPPPPSPPPPPPIADKHTATGWPLVLLCCQAIGVVYGDLGTSPLYVLNGIFPADGDAPSQEDVIGVVSTIVWIFTIVVVCKYALIVLRFGNGFGEGGPFALLLSLYPDGPSGRGHHDDALMPSQQPPMSLTMTSHKTMDDADDDAEDAARRRRRGRHVAFLHRPMVRATLFAWALLGSAMTLADGILTPAVSVVSAAAGIAVVEPSQSDNIRPIAIAILVGLIVAQSFGIRTLAVPFAPIVALWLLFLLITGAYNTHVHAGIWRACDPSRAVLYFVRTGNFGALGGVILAVTGCEALFANLGQLGKRAIQLPLLFIVYPSLMLAYLGQGAILLSRPQDVISNVFYLTIPGGTGGAVYWIGFALGLLATIIASQAMLTAAFSIVAQLMHMHCFPSVRMLFPSLRAGQVYIPVINYVLGAAIVAVVGAYGTSTALTEAYGFAVASVMLITTSLVALSMYVVKRQHAIVAVAFAVAFGFVDALLWGATLLKIPHGAYLTLAIGGAIAAFLWFWTWCTAKVDLFDATNRRLLNQVVGSGTPASVAALRRTTTAFAAPLTMHDDATHTIPRPCSVSVFWNPSGGVGVPHSFVQMLSTYPCCPSVVAFVSLVNVPVATVELQQALTVSRARSVPGFYSATLLQGYKSTLELARLNEVLCEQIIELERQSGCDKSALQYIRRAHATVAHIWPSYYVTSPLIKTTQWYRRPYYAVRAFAVEVIYRRLKGLFAEEDGPFEAHEEVIRITVNARI